jgi:DNA repair protein RecO (recombination protein O)
MAARDRVYRAEALVLRRRNIGEADSVFTFFGPERGRFEAVARGVRKARSRMRGHLEPLTHVEVLVARGRTLDVLTQAETVHAYRGLRENLDHLPRALYCAE